MYYKPYMPKKKKITKAQLKKSYCKECKKQFKPAGYASHIRNVHNGKEVKISNGRKPSVTLEKQKLLRDAFKIGCTNAEACAYADITKSSFYRFIEKDKEFRDKIDAWKLNPNLKARKTIFNGLETIETAKWYAKNKISDEFGERNTQDVNIKDPNAQEEIEKSNKRLGVIEEALARVRAAKDGTEGTS